MADTKTCENCEAEIGTSETTCPKCSVVFEELEQEVKVVERASNVSAKRKAKAAPPVVPPPAAKSKSIFSSLGRIVK